MLEERDKYTDYNIKHNRLCSAFSFEKWKVLSWRVGSTGLAPMLDKPIKLSDRECESLER